MKNLIEYTKHSMISLREYVKESISSDMKLNEASLLDDIDDLEKSSDKSVEESLYIGNQYNVKYVEEEGSFLSNFNIKLLNKMKFKYTNLKSYMLWRDHGRRKPSKYCQKIVNIVLNTDKHLLTEDPKDLDEINVKNELIKRLYSCSYLADNKNFLSIDVYKCRIVGYADWYVNIYNDQDQSALKIILLKK